jgi:molecular chaperone DnaJ
MQRDYYMVLGVAPSDGPETIREAFHELALRYHPDRAGPEATKAFQDVVEAYHVLSDPERRASYDLGLRHARGEAARDQIPLTPPRPAPVRPEPLVPEPLAPAPLSLMRDFEARTPSVEDVLERFLRNFAPARAPKHEQLRPLDLEIILGPEQAARGGSLTLQVPVFFPCDSCRGTGRVIDYRCPRCFGQALVEETRAVRLFVPPMTRDGTVFELPMRGLGIHNLFLRVRVRVDVP